MLQACAKLIIFCTYTCPDAAASSDANPRQVGVVACATKLELLKTMIDKGILSTLAPVTDLEVFSWAATPAQVVQLRVLAVLSRMTCPKDDPDALILNFPMCLSWYHHFCVDEEA